MGNMGVYAHRFIEVLDKRHYLYGINTRRMHMVSQT